MFQRFRALTAVLGHGNPYGIEVINWCKDGLNIVPTRCNMKWMPSSWIPRFSQL